MDLSRLARRGGGRGLAVRLLHLSDPALDVGVNAAARSAEVIHDQLRVVGIAGRARQRKLRDAHR